MKKVKNILLFGKEIKRVNRGISLSIAWSVFIYGIVTVNALAQQNQALVAQYSFEAASGASVADSSGNGNTGTISGAVRVNNGRFGAALSFDGLDDWVTVPDSNSLDLNAGMTLTAWVNPTATGDWRTVVIKEIPNELAYALYANDTSSQPSGYIRVNGTSLNVQGLSAVPTNSWTHLAVTYDGAFLRFYQDGLEVGAQPMTGPITTSNSPLRIGGNIIWGEYFSGLIDEVRVYNQALSAAEILVDMQGPGDVPPSVTGTVPADGASAVNPVSLVIQATFSEAVDANTVTAATFELLDPLSNAVPATVSYDEPSNTASLIPDSDLLSATTYTAAIRGGASGVTDQSGTPLPTDVEWSFTTEAGSVPDTTPPNVTGTAPADGATEVSLGSSVTATFDEAMDPASITATTFELREAGGALVDASVSYSGLTAVLSPNGGPLTPATNYTATVFGGTNGVTDVAGNFLGSNLSWSFTTASNSAPDCNSGTNTIWSAADVPAITSENDTNAVELGVKFFSDIDGVVCGLRFFKGAANTGTHVGNLWTAGGQLLASATFSGETATGWQQVNFATPVQITANTNYVASYHAPVGGYAKDSGYFTGVQQDNPPLHALEDVASGGNGIYQYGPTGFPANTYQATNYWVDVVFSGGGAGSDTTPPVVSSVTPIADSVDISVSTTVSAVFNEAMAGTSINNSTFELRDAGNNLVAATVGYTGNTATLTPVAALLTDTTYTATLVGGSSGVKDLAGNPLAANFVWSFTTASGSVPDTTPPTVSVTSPNDGATVSGIVSLTADANDDVAVAGVQFMLNGNPLDNEDTQAPYSLNWDTSTVSDGSYVISAVARDSSNNTATSTNVSVTVLSSQPNPPGLVAFYRFEEGSGTNVEDSSDNNNAGTISGATWVTDGAIGNALSFDGINDWVTVADHASLDLTDAMTLEAWVYPVEIADWHTVILKEIPGELAYSLYAHDNSSGPVGYIRSGGNSVGTQGTGALPTCTWTHIAVTYDGSQLRFYRNGVEVASRSASGDIVTSNQALRIGGNSIWQEYFSGRIDEVRIYNIPLNAAQITADMQVSNPPSGGSCSPTPVPAPNFIPDENELPGNPSSEWEVNGAGDSSIQGFATEISVDLGETIGFKIDTPSTDYRLDIYRMGYYNGDGARRVATVEPSVPLPQNQPNCLSDSTGLLDCGNWSESASWQVPTDAVSGIYFAKAIREDGGSSGESSHIVFVVRNDSSNSDILFQTSDTTWQAYNNYGGNNLYGGNGGRARKLSYNRPFATRDVDGGQDWVFNAEYPMVRWLEANGYNVTYTTGIDVDRRGDLLTNHRLFLSVGHDEYWSRDQRENVEAARDSGVHLAFFSGNEVFWKIRWENSIDGSGTPYRTLVCYKDTHDNTTSDPSGIWTGTWRDPRFISPPDAGRPENELTGTIFTVNAGATTSIRVPEENGRLRFWRNTGVANLSPGSEATLPFGTLGYEWDEDLDNGFRPAGLIQLSLTTVNGAPVLQDYGSTYSSDTATHALTLYRAPSGALVFGAGTVQWAWGLDDNHDRSGTQTSQDMQQATVNLLADMNVQPDTIQSGLQVATASSDSSSPTSSISNLQSGDTVGSGSNFTITGTATDSGGGVVGGVEVSTDGGSSWHPANGRENWSYDWFTPNNSTNVTIMTRAADDSANLENPGGGINVNVN